MKHQNQGHNECLPTSLAMLFDIPKDELIEAALLGTQYNFWGEINNEEMYEKLLSNALLFWGIEWGGVELMQPGNGPTAIAGMPGKGLVCWYHPGIKEGHATAIKDGVLYDPADPEGPEDLIEALVTRLLLGWKPMGVQWVEEGEESC